MKKVSTLPNHYDSIEELTLYRWDKYCQTKDNNWFLVDYDGRQKKIEGLKEIEDSLIEQYFKAIDDRSFYLKIQKWAKIDFLRTKYIVVDSLLNRMWLGFSNDQMDVRLSFIQELKKWGFKFPELNSVVDDGLLIVEFRKSLQGIKTQIAMLSDELQEDGKKESHSLQKQLQIATLGLQYPYRLNPKEITLSEWIEICKLLQEKSKQN